MRQLTDFTLRRNNFEQLCINYANERLQQHFNRHLFKLEQEEYSQNGIYWNNVDFVDNTECLNLFEKKPIGILSLLNEESTSPNTTDMTFANKLKQQLSGNACFKRERGGVFRICHFAGEDQLFKLMQKLESTTPHFIRCLKPNGQHLPGLYEYDLFLQQLRCCGVLEVVRISRSGYPTRMTHQQFTERYGFFLLRNDVSKDALSVSVNILQNFNVLPDMYQVGYMKIFFRTGQIASLEEVRHQTLQGILGVQKGFRCLQARRYFQELKNGITTLQSFIRGWLVRKQINGSNRLEMPKINHVKANRGPGKTQESVDMNKNQPQVQHAVVEELQRRVLKAEAALRAKEEENLTLKQQIQQYETRWSYYEAKMKSMENMWQNQMTSLQMNLTAAKQSLVTDGRESQQERHDTSQNNRNAEDTECQTPEGTLAKQPCASATVLPTNSGGTQNAVSHMLKELEQQRKGFEDDARFLIKVKSGQSLSNTNQNEELQKLKARFTSWKKDYKVKLQETKMKLQKLCNSEKVKTRRKWWIMWSSN